MWTLNFYQVHRAVSTWHARALSCTFQKAAHGPIGW